MSVRAAGGTDFDVAAVEEFATFLAALPLCLLCTEGVAREERAPGRWFDQHGELRAVHRDCALREVVGGIGHLTDHALWCGRNGDPDMGLGYRESARRVAYWIAEHGVPRS